MEPDARAEIEVADLDRTESIAVHAQDVLRLEVAVRYTLGVHETQCGRDFAHNLRGRRLAKVLVLLDPLQQLTTVYL